MPRIDRVSHKHSVFVFFGKEQGNAEDHSRLGKKESLLLYPEVSGPTTKT